RLPAAPEGLAASGVSLGEIAGLAPGEALHRLQGSAEGLTPGEAAARLRVIGPNQIAHQVRHTIVGEIFSRSVNPLNLLLLTLAAASFLSGDQRVAIVIMVALSISLGFLQEHRSNKAADALRRMVLTTASVRRKQSAPAIDHVELPIEQLVPGDIVLLSAGDMIPADVRLISAKDLFLNQSTLTGEAMPIEKNAQPLAGA